MVAQTSEAREAENRTTWMFTTACHQIFVKHNQSLTDIVPPRSGKTDHARGMRHNTPTNSHPGAQGAQGAYAM